MPDAAFGGIISAIFEGWMLLCNEPATTADDLHATMKRITTFECSLGGLAS